MKIKILLIKIKYYINNKNNYLIKTLYNKEKINKYIYKQNKLNINIQKLFLNIIYIIFNILIYKII